MLDEADVQITGGGSQFLGIEQRHVQVGQHQPIYLGQLLVANHFIDPHRQLFVTLVGALPGNDVRVVMVSEEFRKRQRFCLGLFLGFEKCPLGSLLPQVDCFLPGSRQSNVVSAADKKVGTGPMNFQSNLVGTVPWVGRCDVNV